MSSEPDEARETLTHLETRLRRDVADMVSVLAADVPVFLQRTIKRFFEHSPHSDRLSDAALAKLKAGSQEASQRLGEAVSKELSPFESWVLEGTLPQDSESLDEHPVVREVLGKVGAELQALLSEAGYPAEELSEDALTYRLPTYFVAGQFMKSLVASYWRTLADYRDLRDRVQAEDQADQREQRRNRWDSA